MDDPKIYTDEERQLLQDDDLAHKLLKKERHLLADLHDAQEAEARALERFRRVQSKLQRRKARVMRLENRLSLTRKELAVLQSNLNSQEQVAVPTPTENRPDTFEPEPFVTPVFVPASQPVDGDNNPVPQPTDMAEPAGEVRANEADAAGDNTQEHPQAQEAVAGVVLVTSAEQPIISEPGASLLEQLARDMNTPPVEAQPALKESRVNNEQSEPAPLIEPEPSLAMESETPPAVIAQEEAASSPMLAEAMGLWKMSQPEAQPEQSTPDDSSASLSPAESITPPRPVPPAKSPVQILNEAREAWQEAEASVQQARNRAHDLAASISILAQTGLSGTLMEELLRKQSEANKALVESQKSARSTYERLVQAEEAYQLAQQEEQSHTNGLTSTSTDEGDATVQMHAIHLYKEW